jgi:hypothetical protein
LVYRALYQRPGDRATQAMEQTKAVALKSPSHGEAAVGVGRAGWGQWRKRVCGELSRPLPDWQGDKCSGLEVALV